MIAYAALAVPLVAPAGLGDGVASLKGHHPTRYEPSFLSKLEPAPHLLSCSVDLPILVFDTRTEPHIGGWTASQITSTTKTAVEVVFTDRRLRVGARIVDRQKHIWRE